MLLQLKQRWGEGSWMLNRLCKKKEKTFLRWTLKDRLIFEDTLKNYELY